MVSEPILPIVYAPLQGLQLVLLGCVLLQQQVSPLYRDLYRDLEPGELALHWGVLLFLLLDPFHDWERMGQHPLVHQETLLLLDLFLSSVPGIVVVVLYPPALLLDLYPPVPVVVLAVAGVLLLLDPFPGVVCAVFLLDAFLSEVLRPEHLVSGVPVEVLVPV